MLEVSAAGYYDWRGRARSAREQKNDALLSEIEVVHKKSRGTYGRPRIHAELHARGVRASPKRIARLMKMAGLQGISPRRFRRTTDSNHRLPIAENLLDRRFDPAAIEIGENVCAGDITCLPTREGWLYLAEVMDLRSRRIVGWSMDTTMQLSLVLRALRAALDARRPTGRTLFHSDRGSQYASTQFRAELLKHGMLPSMSAKGNCWDNAVVESFFGTLKSELGDPNWETRAAARAAIFGDIETWYNPHRSPLEFEVQLAAA